MPLCFTRFPFLDSECNVNSFSVKEIRGEPVWLTVCTYSGVNMILTSLSNLPETTGLFLIGLVLIVSGVVLRRVFVTLESAVPASSHNAESKEHSLK